MDGRVQEFPLPDRKARPHAVAVGPDGTCWVTEWAGNRVASRAPSGHLVEHPLPTPESEPHGLTLGPDGALHVALERGE
ncbi:virginiamycin B lyase, partial [Streptomyces nanshensis]